MRTNAENKLETLRRRRAIIDAEVLRLEARSRQTKRKVDTRRKILIGAIVMQEMENDPEGVGAWIHRLLNDRLPKSRDRMLFDLPPRSVEP